MKLQISGVSKSFGPKQVLQGIDLSVESGDALGLLGRNGAGKTTALRIIMGVFPPDEGTVLLNGKNIDRNKTRIGYLPEERGLYPKKPIMEQLIYFAALKGMKASEARKSALTLLERLGMTEYASKKLEVLSKGNQQKIQLAATLISNPDIIILDEPFSGLDPVNAILLEDIVKEQMAAGKIVFFSSHQMNYIEAFCNDIAILNGGKIVLSGSLREIKRNYDRRKIIITGSQTESIGTYARENWSVMVQSVQVEEGQTALILHKAEQKGALIAALAEARFDMDGFRVFEPSLNDIFVEYTEAAV